MKTIYLANKNVYVKVDDQDYESVSEYHWYGVVMKSGIYAQRNGPTRKGKRKLMHRQIMGALDGQIVDHKNHDTLDNTRANLRFASPTESQRNRRKQKNNTSGYKGVFWAAKNKKWNPKIMVNGKSISLGLYHDKEEAARVYDNAAVKYFGDYAWVNFPATYRD